MPVPLTVPNKHHPVVAFILAQNAFGAIKDIVGDDGRVGCLPRRKLPLLVDSITVRLVEKEAL